MTRLTLALALLAGPAFAGPPSAVISLDAARTQVTPNGKASIQHLALGQNAFIGRLEMAAGAAVPEHQDETEEYIHVLEGHGVITIDGKARQIGPGDTVFMAANATVRYQNGDQKLVALQVFAGPAPAKKYDKWKAPKP
jgi:quercetin dioxygenase-like cupin family protein